MGNCFRKLSLSARKRSTPFLMAEMELSPVDGKSSSTIPGHGIPSVLMRAALAALSRFSRSGGLWLSIGNSFTQYKMHLSALLESRLRKSLVAPFEVFLLARMSPFNFFTLSTMLG